MYCKGCSKKLEKEIKRCPYCGKLNPGHDDDEDKKVNNNSLIGLILSIVGLIIGPLAVVGLILSIKGSQQDTKLNYERGKKYSLVGIILGTIGILMLVYDVMFWFI